MSSFICPAVAAISLDSSDSIDASSLCLGVVGIQITSNTSNVGQTILIKTLLAEHLTGSAKGRIAFDLSIQR